MTCGYSRYTSPRSDMWTVATCNANTRKSRVTRGKFESGTPLQAVSSLFLSQPSTICTEWTSELFSFLEVDLILRTPVCLPFAAHPLMFSICCCCRCLNMHIYLLLFVFCPAVRSCSRYRRSLVIPYSLPANFFEVSEVSPCHTTRLHSIEPTAIHLISCRPFAPQEKLNGGKQQAACIYFL